MVANPPWVSFNDVSRDLRSRGLAQPMATLGPLDATQVAQLVRQQAVWEQTIAAAQRAAFLRGQQQQQHQATSGAQVAPGPVSTSTALSSSSSTAGCAQTLGNDPCRVPVGIIMPTTVVESSHSGLKIQQTVGGGEGTSESGASVLVAEEKDNQCEVKMPLTPSRPSEQGEIGSEEVPRTQHPPADSAE